MTDTTTASIGADALREALWVCVEHNALHFGEIHNTVVQGRAALAGAAPAAQGDALDQGVIDNRCPLRARADELIAIYGSVRAAAQAIGVEASYLFRLSTGEKSSPSDATLAKLGMKRVITYERIQQPIWQATELQPRTKSG